MRRIQTIKQDVSRTGKISAAVKKARQEAERSKMSARMGFDFGCEETKVN